MKRRRFAAVGLGSFGFHVARALHADGHEVLAVDRDPAVLDAIAAHCSVAVVADATDRESLQRAGVAGVDVAVIALGSRIDAAIVATMFLKDLGIREILVKSTTADQARVLRRVGATEILHPEQQVASRLARQLARPDVLEEVPFLEGYVFAEVVAPKALWGKSLARSGLRHGHGLAVVALKRLAQGQPVALPAVPTARIEPGDALVVLVRPEDLESFRCRFAPGQA